MGDPQAVMKSFQPEHDFLVCIDSDGCAFDTMEIKQKECFIPNTIKYWNLQAVSKYARETAEFVNLYSKWRGINRFPALVMVFDLLREREEVKKRNVKIEEARSLKEWIKKESKLGNPTLEVAVNQSDDSVLRRALEWSKAVNRTVGETVKGVPPFPFVRESLQKLVEAVDIIVVSATPGEALIREWEEHNIARYASIIAGQEMGSKKEHIELASRGRYKPGHVLMVGDAPGDMEAARANNALFFPVNPGREDASWELFYNEGLQRLVDRKYAGKYEAKLIEEFEQLLPEVPPWKNKNKK
jgi:phosphoglycolate phosphatase-like HAD superfamily hydrolase